MRVMIDMHGGRLHMSLQTWTQAAVWVVLLLAGKAVLA